MRAYRPLASKVAPHGKMGTPASENVPKSSIWEIV